MPRNPAAKRHPHNNRHETGLVGPGKRVVKQKSNGHLNGAAKAAAGPADPDLHPVDPVSSVSAPGHPPSSSSTTAATDSNPDPAKRAYHTPPKLGESDAAAGENQEKDDRRESNGGAATAHGHVLHQRRPDGNTNTMAAGGKARAAHDATALQIAATILRSRPAFDTVALLIVLLTLPTMVLTIVQALFASLTLVPGGAPASFISVLDIFQSSAGAPSNSTVAVVDVIFLAVWIALWPWAQNFALDLAQIQIAITLGTGSAGRNGKLISGCIAALLALHLIRSTGVRRFLFAHLVPVDLLAQAGLVDYLDYLPSTADFGENPGPPSYLRSLFAIHIIGQAVVAMVRRQLSSEPRSTARAKRVDPEASVGAGADLAALDAVNAAAVSSSVDYQPPPTPGFKDGKEKGMTAKKRRRQANHVRSRQPFWAALASTKVHVLREVEHNKAAPPTGAAHQSGAFETAHRARDLVWVTHVDPASISFEAQYTPPHDLHHQPAPPAPDGRPFYIRINGAKWHSVALDAAGDGEAAPGATAQWTGTISGLAPNCTYTCTFIASDGDDEIAAVMVKTPLLLDKDVPASMAALPARQSTRPSSPTTTLKNSTSNAEARLNDARNRLNKAKRQHRTTVAKVEREVEALQTRLNTASDDTKLRQKLRQAEITIRQNEDAKLEIDAALEDLTATPDEDLAEYAAAKEAYEAQIKLLAEKNDTLAKARADTSNKTACANAEYTAIVSRKERLVSRNTKLTDQHDRITQANAQGLNERDRRAGESAAVDAEQQRQEADVQHQIRSLDYQVTQAKARWESSLRELEECERQEYTHQQWMLRNNGPLTPEGELPGTRPLAQQARPYPFGSLQGYPQSPVIPEVQAEVHSSPFLAYAKTLPSVDQRRSRSNTNRSAGAISNFSADFEDADPIPPMPSTAEYDGTGRKGSGSGSSRGHNNGSPATAMMGGGFRSPQKGNYSPGHVPGTTNW